MAEGKKKSNDRKSDGATVGYEAQLWQMADALRGSMDAAEYKHVVLGLLFLKYISDAFEEKHAALLAENAQGADAEDPDEYRAQSIFWVPPEARWAHLKAQARQSTVGQLVDDAMAGIERDNPALKGVLPKDYARPALDKQRLGQLIDMISNIRVGDEASRAKDVLGRVYEYFLSQFASAEGKKGGEFYTPRCVVKLLVEMLEPYRGRVYDPCCGSSGMFVQSVEFIRAHAKGNGHGGNTGAKARADISIYGQESNYTTWRLARMNLAIRGIDSGQIAQGDTFHNDRHPDLKADFILANPPDVVIRELVSNALIHQDFTVPGTSVMIEIYGNRVEISNPGEPLVPVERFIDGYQSRNERLADLMRRMGICEEKSSGIDRVVQATEFYRLPAPDFRSGFRRTVVTVYGPRPFEEMDRNDRVRACYQRCPLKWVMSERMTDQSLRERFHLGDDKAAIASRVIAATTEAGLIKADESVGGSRKFARDLPFWA